MAILISKDELKLYKDDVPSKCESCDQNFISTKSEAYRHFKGTRIARCCSRKCASDYRTKISNKICECSNCSTLFSRRLSDIRQKNFCSQSCAGTYNNTHKTQGNRRSKLEIWLETELKRLYPELNINFNDKLTINSELDIFFPDLKLAIELNGIFHYEPIYGIDKLSQIKNNDSRKFQACLERSIELCIIDTSAHKYVKPSTSQKYLDIIKNIIESKRAP